MKKTFINAKHLVQEAKNRLIIVVLPFTALYDGLSLSPHDWHKYNRKTLRQYLPDYEILRLKYIDFDEKDQFESYRHIGYLTIVVAQLKNLSRSQIQINNTSIQF